MGMIANLRAMTGQPDLQPTRINFVCAAPLSTQEYQQFVQCPIAFDQPQLELHFPVDYLRLSVTNSDPALKQLLEQQAQTLLSVLPQQVDFFDRLQQAMVKSVQGGEPTLETVARSLAMSRRTLHRRLQERGLVFKELLKAIRYQLARQYLAERHLTLAEIALLLGYSEQSAFSRAFRHWSGTTPLHIASQHGHVDVVKALIAAGADINKERDGGITPLKRATQNNNPEVADLLRKAGAIE